MEEDLLSPNGAEARQNMGSQKMVVDPDFTVEVVREGDSYSAVEAKVVTKSDGAVVVRVLIKG